MAMTKGRRREKDVLVNRLMNTLNRYDLIHKGVRFINYIDLSSDDKRCILIGIEVKSSCNIIGHLDGGGKLDITGSEDWRIEKLIIRINELFSGIEFIGRI